jgi:Holliday junction resolvase RusA-like endonuclease
MGNANRVIGYAPLFYPPHKGYTRLTVFSATGNLPRKSNQRRIVKVKNRPLLIKSKNALAYEQTFMGQVPEYAKQSYGDADHPLALWAHVHYQSNRSDLSVELLKDLLEKAGVVSNDRWIKAEFLFASIDRDNPRVELALYAVSI